MHIERNQIVCGYPIFMIRDLFRRHELFDTDRIASFLNTDKGNANELFMSLIEEGYFEPSNREDMYWLTIKGNALRLASGGKQISRTTADKLVTEFLERVRKLNDDSNYGEQVIKVIVFGSYITDAERLTDIDLAIQLEPKKMDIPITEFANTRACVAEASGRTFSSYIDRLTWFHQECLLFLRNRSKSLSFHLMEDPILTQTRTKVLFNVNDSSTS